jgi:hypothetical protein
LAAASQQQSASSEPSLTREICTHSHQQLRRQQNTLKLTLHTGPAPAVAPETQGCSNIMLLQEATAAALQ